MRSLTAAVLLFTLALASFAQSNRGTITGTIADPAGAVVANAPVQIKNVETGAVYQAASSATGNYTLSQLPAGQYEMSVTVPGFKRYLRQGVTVDVSQTYRVDVSLEVGANTESITVTEAAPLLKTESGELSHNVSTNTMDNLPVMNIGANAGQTGLRNPYSVVQLLPGGSTTVLPGTDIFIRINGNPAIEAAPPGENMERARDAATKALALDNTLAEAHTSLGTVQALHDWQWREAQKTFQRAIHLNPCSSITRNHYGIFCLGPSGKLQEAMDELREAVSLDPLSLTMRTDSAFMAHLADRDNDAISQCRTALDMDPGFFQTYMLLGKVYTQKGIYPEAIRYLQTARELAGSETCVAPILATLALANERAGNHDQARYGALLRRMGLA